MYWILKPKFYNILTHCHINKYSSWPDAQSVAKWGNGNLNPVEPKNTSWRTWVANILSFLFDFSFWKMTDSCNSSVNTISSISLYLFLNCKPGWLFINYLPPFKTLRWTFLTFASFDIQWRMSLLMPVSCLIEFLKFWSSFSDGRIRILLFLNSP